MSPLERLKSKCAICGFAFGALLHRHHIKPRSEGGEDATDNMVMLCPNCHAIAHRLRRSPYQRAFTPDRDKSGLSQEQFDKLVEIAKTETFGKI